MQKLIGYSLFAMLILSGFCFGSLAQLSSSEIKVLSEKADVILTGKVAQQTSSWNENKSRIYTHATIQVEEYLKGNNSGNTVTVTYPGGEVGDIGEMYSHMPSLENNEEVLLFLKKDSKNTSFKVVNGEDGKISITTDPKTGEKITTSKRHLNSLATQIKSYIDSKQ
jgi:hypothetical protein